MLFGWQESWAANGQAASAIIFVTAAQMLCGVAKDLTKLGGKTVTKLVTPDEMQVCVLGGGVRRVQSVGVQVIVSYSGDMSITVTL